MDLLVLFGGGVVEYCVDVFVEYVGEVFVWF